MKNHKLSALAIAVLMLFCSSCGKTEIGDITSKDTNTAEVTDKSPDAADYFKSAVAATANSAAQDADNTENTDSAVSPLPGTSAENAPEKASVSNSGTELVIYGDLSIQHYIENYYLPNNPIKSGVEISFTHFGEGALASALEEMYTGEYTAYGGQPDLILAGTDYTAKYLYSELAVPLSDLGIDKSELSDQFEFTKKLTTDDNGIQRGVMFDLEPEVFIYRKSIAKAVLGTDDPQKIGDYVKDFESFEATAEKMRAGGYAMLGSYEETFRYYTQASETPVFDSNGRYKLADAWENWAHETKRFADNDYIINAYQYKSSWEEGITNDEAFGYIGSSRYAEEEIADYTDDNGDWAACPGPAATYQNGAVFFAVNGTDNADIVADIMLKLTTDKDLLKKIAVSENIVTNTVSGMSELAEEKVQSEFFGSFNPYGAYTQVAKEISKQNKNPRCAFEPYQHLFEIFDEDMSFYFINMTGYSNVVGYFDKDIHNTMPSIARANGRVIYITYKAADDATEQDLETAREFLLLRIDAKKLYASCEIDYKGKILTLELFNPDSLNMAKRLAAELTEPAVITIREGNERNRDTGEPIGITATTVICETADIVRAKGEQYKEPRQSAEWGVSIVFTEQGLKKFTEGFDAAKENREEVSIWLDNSLLFSTGIKPVVDGQKVLLKGTYRANDAMDIADKITTGLISVKLEQLDIMYDTRVY
jgi:hypothetical protein